MKENLHQSSCYPFLDSLPDPAIIVDGDGVISAHNALAAMSFGMSQGEIQGEPIHKLFKKVPGATSWDDISSFLQNDTPWSGIVNVSTNKGDMRQQRWHVSILNGFDTPLILIVVKDQVLSAEPNQLSADVFLGLFKPLVDGIQDIVHVMDEDLRVRLINKAGLQWCAALGVDNSEVVGKSLKEIFPILDDSVMEEYRAVLKQGRSLTTEDSNVVNSQVVFTETRKIPVRFQDGSIWIITLVHDITPQKQALLALKESEESYRLLIEHQIDPVVKVSRDDKLLYVNPPFCDLFDKTAKELTNQNYFDLIHPDDHQRLRDTWQLLVEPPHTCTIELRGNTKLGVRWFLLSAKAVQNHEKEVVSIVTVARDIHERKLAEQALRESEEILKLFAENVSDVYWVRDMSMKTTYITPSIQQQLGYTVEEAKNLNMEDVVTPEGIEAIANHLALGIQNGIDQQSAEIEHIHKDGHSVWIEVNSQLIRDDNGIPVKLQGVSRDITERKRTQAQLSNQQKLEAIGTLASGIAHEINNPINIIMNYGELISSCADQIDKVQHYSDEIKSESKRIAGIVANLLSFASQVEEIHGKHEIEQIVRSTVSLIHKVLEKDHIELELAFGPDLPQLTCRSQQVKQVLLNLITNARDALNERYNGEVGKKLIQISCSRVDRDGELYIRTTVQDNGRGIDPSNSRRIFDPFFTTKPRDKGTGLGLSVSYGLMQDHGGELSYESEVNHYTRFHMDLPCNFMANRKRN